MKSKIKLLLKKVIIITLAIATGILPTISNINASSNTTGYIWHDDWYLAYPQTGVTNQPVSQLLINNEEAYCLDPYTTFKPNVDMTIVDWSTVGISSQTGVKISLISYFDSKVSGRTHANWYAVTQGLIWKTLLHDQNTN